VFVKILRWENPQNLGERIEEYQKSWDSEVEYGCEKCGNELRWVQKDTAPWDYEHGRYICSSCQHEQYNSFRTKPDRDPPKSLYGNRLLKKKGKYRYFFINDSPGLIIFIWLGFLSIILTYLFST
jgi:DNA-directed RNA polymerase subunit RPC12/RpoP